MASLGAPSLASVSADVVAALEGSSGADVVVPFDGAVEGLMLDELEFVALVGLLEETPGVEVVGPGAVVADVVSTVVEDVVVIVVVVVAGVSEGAFP